MTQNNISREVNQLLLENCLTRLGMSELIVNNIETRVKQAMFRKPELSELLQPALEEIEEILCNLSNTKREFSELWMKGQYANWWD